MTAAVLVLNYNGAAYLEACLSTARRAAASAGAPCRVVLVDNRSTDGSVAFARARFPDVEIVISPANDFLFSLNGVVGGRREDVVVIVNNDMRFDDGFVAALLPHFADPRVFAATARIRTWDGAHDTVGPRCARLSRCWFYKWWALDRQETARTLEACGGSTTKAAEILQISVRTIQYRLHQYGLRTKNGSRSSRPAPAASAPSPPPSGDGHVAA